MKKGIMKKLMASVLAAALIATSVDYSWALVSVAAGNTTVITDGQLVAENYADKLTKQEIAVLESPVINGTTHTVTRPTADDNLVAVDSDNKTIYAKSFTKDGYTWVAEQAAILVDGATKETVTLEAKDSKYDGVSYDASGTFAFNENGYQVKVVYKLYITVSEDTQWDLLNTPYYLADGINNMNAIKEAAKDMKTIIKYVAPELESYVDGSNPLQFTGRTKEIVESWLEQRDAYNDSELSNLLTVNGYNTATSKVNNIIQYGTAYKECAEGIYDDLSYLATSDAFKLADQMYDLGIIDTLEGTIEALEPAMTSQWKILESGDMVKTNLADEAFDTLVTAAFDNSSIHSSTDITIAEKILADTVELTCNVNRYDVVVTVNALVIDAANKEVSLKEFTATVNVASGEPAANVIEEAEKLEAEALNYWNSLNDGIYAINTANYERVTAGLTADTVTDNGTYKIAYSPKTFKITIDGKETNAKYGETITFAKADDPDQAYEYTDEAGKIHEQGTTYRVTGNAAFSRSLGKAKTEVRVYDIITSYYKLPKAEADILGNLAVNSDYIYVRMADISLVSLDDLTVTAQQYNAGNGMYWIPEKVIVNKGNAVAETLTFTNGVATITDKEFTDIEIIYSLEAEVSDEVILEGLNLPAQLVAEAVQQLADIKTLAGYKGDLKEITAGLLDLVRAKLNAESQKAIDDIAAFGCDENGTLLLSVYIAEYETLTTDKERLNWYYSNDMYSKLRYQADLIADSMAVIVGDPALPELLNSIGKGEYTEKLETAADSLEKLKGKFPAKNEKINPESTQYLNLLDAILAGKGKVNSYNTQNGLYLSETFTKEASTRASVEVVVQVVDGAGNVINTKNYRDTFAKANGLTSTELATFLAKITAFENEIVDKAHYTSSVTGAFPEANTELTGNVKVVYTWSPKEYTVTIEGEADQSFYYGNAVITLPASSDAAIKYYYIIGTDRIEVTTENKTYVIKDVDALFGNDTTYAIVREEVDVQIERVENLIKDLNQALANKGLTDVVSFIPFEDAEGNISIVLRVNAFDGNISAALTEAAMVLAKQTYVGIGNEAFIDKGIHVNAFVNLLLDSGIGTSSLIAMIDENGNIVENTKDKVKGQTVLQDLAAGVANTTDLGGLLMESTLSINKGSAGMPLYISLQDYDQSADTLKSLREALVAVEKYAVIICQDGEVQIKATAPEKAHEMLLAAMLMEGKLDLNNFKVPSLTDMWDYAYDKIEESIVKNKEADADTILNSVGMVSAGTDLSGYKATINKVLKLLRVMMDEDLTNGEFIETNEEGQAKDTYKGTLSCPIEKVVTAAGIDAGIVEMLSEEDKEIAVPLNIKLTNCNTEYEAVIFDINAEGIVNKADFTTDAAAAVAKANDNAVVILLKDVAKITADSTLVLDLNGKTLGTLTANKKVLVADSSLGANVSGTIEAISGNAQITAGKYAQDVTEMLPEGYKQTEGVVSNRYYTIVEDADGNLTVEIAADFLKTEETIELKTLAVEMALDLVLNAYTSAGITIDGNQMYEIDLPDVLASYKAGLKNTAGELLEQINCDSIEIFANELLQTLTDFTAMAEAIEADKAIASYAVTTKPWEVTVGYMADDYLTAAIGAGEATDRTLTIVVSGTDEEKAALAALCTELGKILTFNTLSVTLDDLTYGSEGFVVEAGADIDISVDLSGKDYVAVIGVILANGMADGEGKQALTDAINKYLEKEGVTTDLVEIIENMPSSQIIRALKAAANVEFADMAEALGITPSEEMSELADTYCDLLNLGYKLIAKLNLTGGNKVLASFNNGEFATYEVSRENWKRMNVALKVKLCNEKEEEVITYPDAVILTPVINKNTTVAYEGFKVEGNRIYLDVATDGITPEQFKELVSFPLQDDYGTITSVEVTKHSNGLVYAGSTVTVTAVNEDPENPTYTDPVVYEIIIIGDANKNGQVTSQDASLILAYTVGKEDLDGIQLAAADINRSTTVTAQDASKVLRKSVKGDYDSSYKE